MDVAITGSSGLVGTALRTALTETGHNPIRLVRRAPKSANEIEWDPSGGKLDPEALEGVDAGVHRAGAGIGSKRWNDEYKQVLVDSRVAGTTLLANTLAGLTTPPKVLLSGSAIGYYGDRGSTTLTETSPPATNDFLADLCVQWEAAAQPAADAGIRTAFLRTGIVQSPEGGALSKTLPLFKLYLGGKFGNGEQYLSWIHIDDMAGAIIHLLTADVDGPVNMTAPNPVTNATYTEALGDALGRPTFATVPEFGPKLLLGGDMADALLFDSMKVDPAVLRASGYAFQYETVDRALNDLVG